MPTTWDQEDEATLSPDSEKDNGEDFIEKQLGNVTKKKKKAKKSVAFQAQPLDVTETSMPEEPAKIIQDLLGKLMAKDKTIMEFQKDLKEKAKTIDFQQKLLGRQLPLGANTGI